MPSWVEVSGKAACFSLWFVTCHQKDSTVRTNVLYSLLNEAKAVHVKKPECSSWNYPILGDANWLPSFYWKRCDDILAVHTWHHNWSCFCGLLFYIEPRKHRLATGKDYLLSISRSGSAPVPNEAHYHREGTN